MIKTFRKISLLMLILIGSRFLVHAQQQYYLAPYMNNLTPINQAYSTMDDAIKVNLTGRKQFIGINDAPSSVLLNGSIPIPSLNSSAGAIIDYNKIGVENSTGINVFFAKKIRLTQATFLSTSVSAGIRNQKINYSSVDPQDPEFNHADIHLNSANIGLGVMLYSDKGYIGFSIPQMFLNNYQNLNNPCYFAAGYLASLGVDFKIKPAALISYTDSSLPLNLDLSTIVYLKDFIGLGIGYRNKQSISGLLSLMISNNLQLGYSYNHNTGSFSENGLNNANQEVTIAYRIGKGISSIKLL